jgi:lysozyme family protein
VIDKRTFAAVQSHIGAPYHDGVADNQNSAAIAAHWPSLTSFTVGDGGSPSVKSLQARIGVEQDGELGEKTASALQKRLNSGRL